MANADAEINPVITLTVRAYDDGIPSLDAEVPVHIFTEDVSSRMMRFIVSQDPESVGENQDQVIERFYGIFFSFCFVFIKLIKQSSFLINHIRVFRNP